MLDLSIYKSRYYQVKLDENTTINVEPPKRKQLKKIISLTKSITNQQLNEEDIDSLYEAAEIALSKNKEGVEFTPERVEDYLNLNALVAFFEGYYSWVTENVNQKN